MRFCPTVKILAVYTCGLAATLLAAAPPYVISTYAGGAWPTLPAPGTSVSVGFPQSVASDGHGGVYFTSGGLDGIFKLDSSGNLTVVVGSGMPLGATVSPFGPTFGLAADGAGNIFVAKGSSSVVKVDSNGVTTTVATGFSCPCDVAVDAAGAVYVADTSNGRLKKVSGGHTTTIAGGGTLVGSAANGHAGTQALLSRPTGVAVDGSGNVFVTDAGQNYIYKVDQGGTINLVAGDGGTATPPADGAAATSGSVSAQTSLGADSAGNLYIPDTLTDTIRKVDINGVITTIAGVGGSMGFAGDGGPATSATLSSPADAAPDTDSSLWIADTSNFRVRKVDAAAVIHTVAGNSGWSFSGDGGPATSAQLSVIGGIALDSAGNLFIADTNNVRVRKVSSSGTITTIAGNGIMGLSGDGGLATSAELFAPSSVAVDSSGNLYIGDARQVRKVNTGGNINTVLATGLYPNVAVDPAGKLYVADSNRIRMVDSSGNVFTVAGVGTPGFSGDGGPAVSAQLNDPAGLFLDSGNLYVADRGNARIRMVNPSGVISTIAGNGTKGYLGDDGPATLAELWQPSDVAIDASGNLLIADGWYVRQVDKNGTITTAAAPLNGAVGIAASGGKILVAESGNNVVRSLAPPTPDLTAAVTHAGSFAVGQTDAAFTITVSNSGTGPTSGTVTVVDTLPPSLTATALTGSGWTCTLGTLTCTRSDARDAGDSFPAITLTATVASNAPGSVSNSATVSGGGETNAANDTASDVVLVTGPTDLTIIKMHTGAFSPGQTGATYTISVSNLGPLTATGTVTVTDLLPAKLTATAMGGTGWDCTVATLTCARGDLLAVGASYPAITLTVNVASNASATVTNTATVSGGGDNVPGNNTSVDPTTIVVPADLTIIKSHIGSFTQGQNGALYSITVTNSGGGPTSGTVTVVDTLPAGLTAVGMSGTGWSCTLATLTCTRSDVLAVSASYPAIAVSVNVASNAAATISNKAVVSGGGETNTTNDTALDSTTVNARQDLAVTKTHTGNFTQGQTGATYTIRVSNPGRAPTSGTVTMVDTLPPGLTATALTGTGWTCTLGTTTCTRSDALAGGAQYPNITLTVNVASTAPASVTNIAAVSGGGQVDLSDDEALDQTTIVQHPDLTITKTHSGSFTLGQTGAIYTVTVTNSGTGSTSGVVTVTDTLPGALTATAMAGSGWGCTLSTLTCSRSDVLAAGSAYPPITLTVNVSATAPTNFTNTATVSGGGDTNSGNNTASDPTSTGSAPDLTVTKTHFGSFSQGQAGAIYTITVGNAGSVATTGTVTLADTLPAKMTAATIGGTGWNCTLATLTCTRSDALAAGGAYPAVTLTVNVAADAPASLTNNATVSGGGEANTSNDTASDVTAIVPVGGCTYSLSTGSMTFPGSGGSLTVNVTTGAGCAWTVTNNLSWVTLTSAASGSGSGTVSFTAAANTGAARSGSLAIAGATFTVQQAGASVTGARFVPVTPCRIADTRGATGAFGGPSMDDDSTRSFAIPQSACGIPETAQAYSLNVTVVPKGSLSYLTLWPAGQAKPLVSTLNSFAGAVVANAAIVPAGDNGAVSVYVSNATDVILDIDGYFDAPGAVTSYSFYPALPCRVADTRNALGTFGGPSLAAGQARDFPVPTSGCGLPATAAAYSLNVTAVPDAVSQYLGYLTIWPAGQTQPTASTLNSWDGRIVANAAIVPAGGSGSISVFVPNPSDVVLDANGYFAPPGAPGALSFYPVAPCRVADTRNAAGPFGGPVMDAATSRSFAIPASGCFVPSNALAYSVNVTVVPKGSLSYLTVWPAGMQQPFVSTLNSLNGSVVANAAIVPAGTNGAISVFVTDRTDVILDINGYFAQ